MYECKLCEFSTKIKKNYAIHCESEKHKKNEINAAKCICQYCDKEFAQKRYLKVHEKLCSLKTNINIYKEQIIDEKLDQINLLKKELEKKDLENICLKEKYKKKLENEKKEIVEKYEREKKRYLFEHHKVIEQYESDKIKHTSQYEKHIEIFTLELKNLHNIIKESGTIIKSSMSGLKYTVKQFDKASPLQAFITCDLYKQF